MENIVEKGENAGYQHFLPFPQCFLLCQRKKLNLVTFSLTSANAFNLVQFKNLSFGKEINCHGDAISQLPFARAGLSDCRIFQEWKIHVRQLRLDYFIWYLKSNLSSYIYCKPYHTPVVVSLTLSQMASFRLFQTKRGCRQQFQIDENGRKFSTRVENTMGKGEIARYEQFLLFPQCFQKTIAAGT